MRQHHQIQTLRRKRQLGKIMQQGNRQGCLRWDVSIGQPTMRHPVGVQCGDLRQPYLHCIEAENIRGQGIETGLLPSAHIAASRRIEPGAERYNEPF